MISEEDSLLKYDMPILVEGDKDEKPKKVTPEEIAAAGPVPSSPPAKTSESNQQMEKILHEILPPREWTEGEQFWIQKVSSSPSTRLDVIELQKELFLKLHQRQARSTGVCPIRRWLFTQCFDELIRQVTINCAERGMLLLHVRDELRMTISVYRTLYESGVAFGMKKAVQNENDVNTLEKTSTDLQAENEGLKHELYAQKTKFEDLETCVSERRQANTKQHTEEILSLRRTIQQLKDQLQLIVSPDS